MNGETKKPVKIHLQPKQEDFEKALERFPVVLYGGAKGGGKSYAIRSLLLLRRLKYSGTKGLLIRKTYDQLNINHIQELYKEHPQLMRKYFNRGDKVLELPNNSKLYFRHLQHFADVYNYAGSEFDDIGIDEVTQHAKEEFEVLKTSNRTTKANFLPRFIMGGNPGGPGHAWVKKLFIDRQFEAHEKPEDFSFVPARIYDNAVLMKADPGYLRRLEGLPEQRRKAFLNGDWNQFEGQFFTEWQETLADGRGYHVVQPFPIPDYWKRFIAIDWGYFPGWTAVGWYAVAPNNRIYKYNELSLQRANAREVGERIVEMSGDSGIAYVAADPSIWIKSQGDSAPSIAEEIEDGGVTSSLLKKANNDRINGWAMVHKYLSPAADGLPWLQIFSTCTKTIESIPAMVHDEVRKGEDLDTTNNLDHWVDETRYACMSRPFRTSGSIVGAGPNMFDELNRSMEIDEEGNIPNYLERAIKESMKVENQDID